MLLFYINDLSGRVKEVEEHICLCPLVLLFSEDDVLIEAALPKREPIRNIYNVKFTY